MFSLVNLCPSTASRNDSQCLVSVGIVLVDHSRGIARKARYLGCRVSREDLSQVERPWRIGCTSIGNEAVVAERRESTRAEAKEAGGRRPKSKREQTGARSVPPVSLAHSFRAFAHALLPLISPFAHRPNRNLPPTRPASLRALKARDYTRRQ